MPSQLSLFYFPRQKVTHGGSRTAGKRKVRRPLIKSKPLHLVMKSKVAVGAKSLWNKEKKPLIENLIRTKANENGVQILEAVNMGNHLHLKIRIVGRRQFQRFLRTITGIIARIMLDAEKGRARGPFWEFLAYSRVLLTSFEEFQLRGYFRANRIERSYGYRARSEFLKSHNERMRKLKRTDPQTRKE